MRKPLHLHDGDPWMLGEDIPDMDFFFSQIWVSGFANEFLKHISTAYKKVLSVHRGYHLWFYYGETDSRQVGDVLVKKFVSKPLFVKRVNKEIIKSSDRLRKFAESLPTEKCKNLSNDKLWNLYQQHDRLHTDYYSWGWIPVAADMFHSNFTEKLKQYLRSIDVPEIKVNEYLVALTHSSTPSLIQKQQDDFLRIANDIWKISKLRRSFRLQRGKGIHQLPLRFQKQIINYHKKYSYVSRMWIGKPATIHDVVKELYQVLDSDIPPAKILARQRKEQLDGQRLRKALLQKLRITGQWRMLFDGFADFMVTKIYRRYAQLYALYRMEPVQKEIARRLGISMKQMRFMLPREVKAALQSGRAPVKVLRERIKFCVYYVERNFDMVVTGQRARQLARAAQPQVTEAHELHGQTGCIGTARGTVRIVIRPKDMKKMKKGDILVSIATDPDIVPAMKIAAAIVTEQGGVTSHAAIVSRELKIPCVIGTKIATRVLKDGDMVEVDATRGIVRKI